ncbi:MAG TPA: flagellar basal body-associated protein FliL [Buttiauxella sp.]|jgi:flagellar FliL protein
MPKKNKKNDSGSGKKSSIVILLLLLLVIAACGVAGFTFYEMNKMKKDVASTDKVEEAVAVPVPMYVPLETFTVSLKPDSQENDSDHVLYIGLTLRVKNDESKELIEKFLPEIRSRLLILFSQQTSEYLSTDEGKRNLIDKIKTVANQPLADKHSANVTDVLFNAFILR